MFTRTRVWYVRDRALDSRLPCSQDSEGVYALHTPQRSVHICGGYWGKLGKRTEDEAEEERVKNRWKRGKCSRGKSKWRPFAEEFFFRWLRAHPRPIGPSD